MLKTVDCLVLRIDEQQRVDRGSVRAFEEAVAQLRQAYYRALARTGNRAYIRIELLAEAEESWRG